jgi:hypothetical protein
MRRNNRESNELFYRKTSVVPHVISVIMWRRYSSYDGTAGTIPPLEYLQWAQG